MTQKMFKAKITPAIGGSPIEVVIPANDSFQAKKLVEAQYGPVKSWWQHPTPIK